MTIQLKKKIVPAPVSVGLTDLQAQIDKVGLLSEAAAEVEARIKVEAERLKPYKDELAKLQKMVEDLDTDPDQPLNEMGEMFRMEAGLVGKTRTIKNLVMVRKMMGDPMFMKLATVKLGDLDKYLTPPQLDEVLTTSRSTRTVKIIRRVP